MSCHLITDQLQINPLDVRELPGREPNR